MGSIEQIRQRILEGAILRTALWLAWPLMVAQLVNVSYNIIDSIWLGRLGPRAFAAPMVCSPLVMFIYSVGAIAMGGLSLISQYIGAGDFRSAERSAGQLISFTFIVGIALSIVGYLIAPIALKLMGVPTGVYPLALAYMRTIFIGVPIAIGGFAYVMISNAVGDTRTPTKLNIASALANIALDPLLIFGIGPFPRLGVVGAAIATIAARSITTSIGLYKLFKGFGGFRVGLEDLRLEARWVRKVLSIGIPISIQQSTTSLGFVVLMSIISRFGTIQIDAYGVALRIMQVDQAIVFGLNRAMSIMVGQCIGAELYDRAKSVARKVGLFMFLSMCAIAAAIVALAPLVIWVFVPDPRVVKAGTVLLRIFAPSMPAFAIHMMAQGIGRGSGHTKIPAALSIARLWGLRVPLAILLPSLGLGVLGVWLAMTVSNVVIGAAAWVWISRGSWLKRVVEVPAMGRMGAVGGIGGAGGAAPG